MRLAEDEKERLMTEARMIQVAAPVLFPMLERRREATIQRLLASYSTGKTDSNAVAELFVIETMQQELRGKLQNLTVLK